MTRTLLAHRAILVVVLLTIAASLAATAGAEPVQQGGCPGNRLANPAFDGGSYKTERLGTSLSSAVGDGWTPWFVRGNETYNREPEFKVEQVRIGGDPMRVRSGGQSQKWFTTWGTHTAGVYQRVGAPAGSTVTFSIHGLAYSGEDDGWDDASRTFRSDPIKPGNYRMAVGIDPGGAVPAMGSHPPASVIWSPPTMTTDVWVPLSVSAVVGRGGTVTVYAKGWPEWPVKHNDSWWDDACLVLGGNAQAAQAAQPAQAANPTAAPTTAAAPPTVPAPTVAAGTTATGAAPRVPVQPEHLPATGRAR